MQIDPANIPRHVVDAVWEAIPDGTEIPAREVIAIALNTLTNGGIRIRVRDHKGFLRIIDADAALAAILIRAKEVDNAD